MNLSIVIPCYNEADNIPLLLERFNKYKTKDIEVILVNNGSTDETRIVLERLLPKYSFVRTVNIAVNQGYGYGILKGLEKATGTYIGWTHADLQTDPRDVIKAWTIIKRYGNQAVFVKGSRKGRPIMDRFFTFGMGCFETLYFQMPMKDINAQPNIFPKSFFKSWKNPPHNFSLDLYAVYMAKRNKLKIIRFPVRFPERIHGSSKWNTGLASKWKFIKRTFMYSMELKKRVY